eukprot:TRINITY_DN9312_c1_g1_i2.p1 TRINITY_DN9312_c1_g1~~TRINITY_DN9312_c1_g1_i2.p1  ORF type:complete len:489 (+),score=108.66 TRINITY_DN9312_c1_g1_i2:29-1495(+)
MLLILLATLVTYAHADQATITIRTDRVHFTVDDKFISVTQDAAIIKSHWSPFDFTSPVGSSCLKALRPAYLRFGGTSEDYLRYNVSLRQLTESNHSMETMSTSDFDLLYDYFVTQGGLQLIFGINDLTSRDSTTQAWNSSNFNSLLDYIEAKNYTIAAFELGNEPDLDTRKNVGPGYGNITAQQLSDDYDVLRKLMQSRRNPTPIFGPDIAAEPEYLADFSKSQAVTSTKKVDAVTVHHYYGNGATFELKDFLSTSVLDSFADKVKGYLSAMAPLGSTPMYIGETSSTYGGGTANLSASYAASFMWNDKLGTAAAWKVPVVMRQTFALDKYSLLNADFIPIPDWYFTFLWKNLMGTRMLNVDGMFDKGRQVRSYAFCAQHTSSDHVKFPLQQGDVAVVVMNFQNESTSVPFNVGNASSTARYTMMVEPDFGQVLSANVTLNGQEWRVADDGTLPDITATTDHGEAALDMEPYATAFVVFSGAKAEACL